MPDTRSEYAQWRDELATTPTTPFPAFKYARWFLALAVFAGALTFLFTHTGA